MHFLYSIHEIKLCSYLEHTCFYFLFVGTSVEQKPRKKTDHCEIKMCKSVIYMFSMSLHFQVLLVCWLLAKDLKKFRRTVCKKTDSNHKKTVI